MAICTKIAENSSKKKLTFFVQKTTEVKVLQVFEIFILWKSQVGSNDALTKTLQCGLSAVNPSMLY